MRVLGGMLPEPTSEEWEATVDREREVDEQGVEGGC